MSNLLQLLKDNDIILNQECILKSGIKSDYYIDIKRTISIPSLYKTIINDLIWQIKMIPNLSNYCIIGVPYSGIPFASVIAYQLGIPLLLLRSEKKTYGTKKLIEGESENKNIILIEDVITTGKSIIETINSLNNCDYKVKYVFTIFNRGNVPFNYFPNINFNYLTEMNTTTLSKLNKLEETHNIYKNLNNIIKNKRTNIILSVDIPESNKFKRTVENLGSHIAGIKVHLDIFPENIRQEIRNFLKKEKIRQGFLVIEDRKYADICSTNILQDRELKTDEYADIIICHGITGFEFMKQVNIPVLLVAQLSNKGNLITSEYTERCVEAAFRNPNIIGFISQENLGYNKCIYCKPGINLDKKSDGLDQRYTGLKEGIDFYIVGRAITESKNPLKEVIRYKNYLLG